MAKTFSAVLVGVEIEVIEIEAFVGSGFSGLTILGLTGDVARDMRERVRAVLETSGIGIPARRVVVNVGPVQALRLCRTQLEELDFAVAACIFYALAEERKSPLAAKRGTVREFFGGSLSLLGELRPVSRPLIYDALEFELVQKGRDVAFHLSQGTAVVEGHRFRMHSLFSDWMKSLSEKTVLIERPQDRVEPGAARLPDFDKRVGAAMHFLSTFSQSPKLAVAILAAAVGRHHILLTGEPGVGKSFAIRHLESLLPPLLPSEAFQVQLINEERECVSAASSVSHFKRPFRAPHHSSSSAALVGGAQLRPGEVTLAHNGALFLDELAEFSRASIEALREPLDSGRISLSKSAGNVTFPAVFLLCATTNPCPCGFLFSRRRSCRCTHAEMARYHTKLSGPMLDRFGIQLMVEPEDRDADVFSREIARALSEGRSRSLAERFVECQDRIFNDHSAYLNFEFSSGELPEQVSRRSQEHLSRLAFTLRSLFPEAIEASWKDVLSYRVLEERLGRIRA
jgi:magnesium chelatase family protein